MSVFRSDEFLPREVTCRLTELRVADPDRPLTCASHRRRRTEPAPDGRLNILAADHPARRVTQVGTDPLAMADRHDYLARVLRVLMAETVDGVMATMDILEELLLIDGMLRDAGGTPLLDNRLLIVSLNRGGLAGTAWELDDPITVGSPRAFSAWRVDGFKFLWRISDEEPDSLKTMLAAAGVISEANAARLPVFLEPLVVARGDAGWKTVKSAGALARLAGAASALGDSSRYLWLKLPYCESYETVAQATTLPILLLGGESAGDPEPFLREVAAGLAAGPNVRGALVGRNVLYPGEEDPLAAAEAAGGIIHKGWTVAEAQEARRANRGRDLDRVARLLAG